MNDKERLKIAIEALSDVRQYLTWLGYDSLYIGDGYGSASRSKRIDVDKALSQITQESDRCKHDIHGTDCYECHPIPEVKRDPREFWISISEYGDKYIFEKECDGCIHVREVIEGE